MATPAPATFAQLLEHAVNEPGILSNAYRQFHGYSIGNQLLALSQCLAVFAKHVVHPEHSEKNGVATHQFNSEEAPDEASS